MPESVRSSLFFIATQNILNLCIASDSSVLLKGPIIKCVFLLFDRRHDKTMWNPIKYNERKIFKTKVIVPKWDAIPVSFVAFTGYLIFYYLNTHFINPKMIENCPLVQNQIIYRNLIIMSNISD